VLTARPQSTNADLLRVTVIRPTSRSRSADAALSQPVVPQFNKRLQFDPSNLSHPVEAADGT
jgi:hypothetical protein